MADPSASAPADHPERLAMAAELHARPFPRLTGPGDAAFLALMPPGGVARDRAAERAHLARLLAAFGVPEPAGGATHWAGRLGPLLFKWEGHAEFVTCLLWLPDGAVEGAGADAASDPAALLPDGWLAATGARVAAVRIRVARPAPEAEAAAEAQRLFDPASLVLSRPLDGQAMLAGDFRLDAGGWMRFTLWPAAGTGSGRTGRLVQHLCEIETYRAMAMLGFAEARTLAAPMGALDGRLDGLVESMATGASAPAQTLHRLLDAAAEVEHLASRAAFRLSATAAYESIVIERLEALREARLEGRQTLQEFFRRRFDPAMRTAASTDRRLAALAARAVRASDLLRTRVEVERSGESQTLLESMDRRADLALRLQHTVEGLSVMAISYYATGLALYLLAPFAEAAHLDKPVLAAGLALVVTATVWAGLRRVRTRLHH